MSRPDGGPAFPTEHNFVGRHGGYDGLLAQGYGMSLRDYFAAKAMQGLCANSCETVITAMGKDAVERGESRMSQTYAREAYEVADAMLAERGKP